MDESVAEMNELAASGTEVLKDVGSGFIRDWWSITLGQCDALSGSYLRKAIRGAVQI